MAVVLCGSELVKCCSEGIYGVVELGDVWARRHGESSSDESTRIIGLKLF